MRQRSIFLDALTGAAILACALTPCAFAADDQPAEGHAPPPMDATAQAELDKFASRVERFKMIELFANEPETVLIALGGITIQELRTVALDDEPPVVGDPLVIDEDPTALGANQ